MAFSCGYLDQIGSRIPTEKARSSRDRDVVLNRGTGMLEKPPDLVQIGDTEAEMPPRVRVTLTGEEMNFLAVRRADPEQGQMTERWRRGDFAETEKAIVEGLERLSV